MSSVFRLILVYILGSFSLIHQQLTQLPASGVIHQNLTLNGGYLTRVPTANGAAVTISGSNTVVDFGNAIVRSSPHPRQNLESKTGVGILIENCRNVTLKNVRVWGYQTNILVKNCQNITLDGVDASYSKSDLMKQNGRHIDSFLDLRSLRAWESYGCGIRINNSSDCSVQNSEASDSQNGILLENSDHCRIINNTCMFNSGWGIGLWQSKSNIIDWNHLDFCNRRWGSGWGGDAAALVLANNCHKNVFYGDSMTHSGDGFFLSDKVNGGFSEADHKFHFLGGSNDNIIADCDGSYASANAFEDTFSDRNIFLYDQANNSRYGFWIGFSNDTVIGYSSIQDNGVDGIAGGQGARTRIESDTFAQNGHKDGEFWSDGGIVSIQKPSADIEIQNSPKSEPGSYLFTNSSGIVYSQANSSPQIFGNPSPQTPKPGSVDRVKNRIQALLDSQEDLKPHGWQFYGETKMPKSDKWLCISKYGPFDFRHQLAAIHRTSRRLNLKLLHLGSVVECPNDLQFGVPPKQDEIVVLPKNSHYPKSKYLPYSISLANAQMHQTQVISGVFESQDWLAQWYPSTAAPDFAKSGKGPTLDEWHQLLQGRPTYQSRVHTLSARPSTGDSPTEPNEGLVLAAKTAFIVPTGVFKFKIVANGPVQFFLDGSLCTANQNLGKSCQVEVTKNLIAGAHWALLTFAKNSPDASVHLNWHLEPLVPTASKN